MGWEGASMSIPRGGRCCKSVCSGRVSALVMSALSLSRQILVMFQAHWKMKAFPSSTCRLEGGESQGGDLTLNSPLRTWLSLINFLMV